MAAGSPFNDLPTLVLPTNGLPESFLTEKQLNFPDHFEPNCENPFKCAFCEKRFPFFSVMKSHERVHTGEKPYECQVCQKTFAQRGSLTIHERKHTGEKPYQCGFCEKRFASQGNMKIHERQHTGQKPYTCNECGKAFSTVGSLRTHEISHSAVKQYNCDVCGKDFAHRTSLYTHKKRHENGDTSETSPRSGSRASSPLDLQSEDGSLPATPSSQGGSTTTSKEKRWECRFCGKRFAFRHPMVAHERVHTGERPFSCSYCPKTFAQQTSLIMHERSHTGERRYKCETCDKRFIQPAALHAHRRIHTGEKPYKCQICPKAFAHATSLRQHNMVHARDALRQLKEHDRDAPAPTTPVPGNLDFSLRSPEEAIQFEDQSPSVEDVSTADSKDSLYIKGDLNVSYDEEISIKFESPKSQTTDASPSRQELLNQLSISTATSSGQKKDLHTCFCGKSFAYLSILEAHMRSHTGEKPFGCQYCDKHFAQKATLQVHERTHTGERPYKCKFCEKTFAQYGTKSVHEKSHLGIRNYKCQECGKCLSSPSALYTHKKTHGEKKFHCEFCPKNFTLKNYLKLHVKQVHEGKEKSHQCTYCGKSFGYVGSLQVHIRTHTGERPYQCQYCPKAFTSQGNLQSHERTHTGEKPFVCGICGRGFAQKSQLSVHEVTHVNSDSGHNSPPTLVPLKRDSGVQLPECAQLQNGSPITTMVGANAQFSPNLKLDPAAILDNFCQQAGGNAPVTPTTPNLPTTPVQTPTDLLNRMGSSDKPQKSGSDFLCKYCGKKFAYASSLYVHTRLHTGERPFKCSYCDKAFTNQGNMQVHERVHTGERPYKCPACDKSYAQKVGLKIHLEQCQRYLTAKASSPEAPSNILEDPDSDKNRDTKKRRLEDLLPKLFNGKVKQPRSPSVSRQMSVVANTPLLENVHPNASSTQHNLHMSSNLHTPQQSLLTSPSQPALLRPEDVILAQQKLLDMQMQLLNAMKSGVGSFGAVPNLHNAPTPPMTVGGADQSPLLAQLAASYALGGAGLNLPGLHGSSGGGLNLANEMAAGLEPKTEAPQKSNGWEPPALSIV